MFLYIFYKNILAVPSGVGPLSVGSLSDGNFSEDPYASNLYGPGVIATGPFMNGPYAGAPHPAGALASGRVGTNPYTAGLSGRLGNRVLSNGNAGKDRLGNRYGNTTPETLLKDQAALNQNKIADATRKANLALSAMVTGDVRNVAPLNYLARHPYAVK